MKKLMGLGVVLLAMVTLSACGSGNSENSADKSNKTEQTSKEPEKAKDETKSSVTFENDTLTTNDFVFKLTGSKVVTDVGDEKALLITYEFTNNTEETQTPLFEFTSHFGLSQETESTVETLTSTMFSVSDDNEDTQALDMAHSDIKPGATVKSATLVRLVNDETVKMTVKDDSYNDIAEKDYSVN